MDTTFFFVSHRSNNSKRQKPKLFVTLLMARMLSQKIWHDPVLDSGMYILPSPTHQNEPFYFWCRDRIFIWNRKRMLFIGFPKGYKLQRSGTILNLLIPWKNCQFNVCGLLMCRVIHTGKCGISTWALTVTTHRHTQVKPLFTYFHQYNLSWWKNGQKNSPFFLKMVFHLKK